MYVCLQVQGLNMENLQTLSPTQPSWIFHWKNGKHVGLARGNVYVCKDVMDSHALFELLDNGALF